jgi:hypothetical protein
MADEHETAGQRFLRHLWDGHVGGYDDTCPHDCPRCRGVGCDHPRPSD